MDSSNESFNELAKLGSSLVTMPHKNRDTLPHQLSPPANPQAWHFNYKF